MLASLFVLSVFQIAVIAILHIDHAIVENNKKYNNLTHDYWHDHTGNAKVSATMTTFAVATKVTVYIKVNIAEDIHDDLFKKEFLRTQVDFQKLYEGIYGNFLIKGFMESFIQDIKEQNLSMPVKAVRTLLSYLENNIEILYFCREPIT